MKYKLIVIGASLGGLHALRTILSALPVDFRLPLAVVQHRNPDAGDQLQFVLQESCALPVRTAEDKTPLAPGTVYLAEANYHLLVDGDHFALSTEDAVNHARPSIDVLFETAAERYGKQTIGVVLTGTGKDGALGLAAIQRSGGLTLVESPVSAQEQGMPVAAISVTANSTLLKLEEIGPYLVALSLK